MRKACLSGLVLGAWLTLSAPAWGGVYFASDPSGLSPLPPDILREHFNVRGCNDDRDKASRTRQPDYQSTPRRVDVLKRLALLEAKGDLSTFERIDLGA